MKCSVCGAEGLCWYNKQRRLVCRDCRNAEQIAERDAQRAKEIGQRRWWDAFTQVTIEGFRGGWVLVRDDAGKQHRVREHNLRMYR